MTKNEAICSIIGEYERAVSLFPPFRSEHEGYAIIYEEMDELWEEIKKKRKTKHQIKKQAIQVATMAVRFLIDLC